MKKLMIKLTVLTLFAITLAGSAFASELTWISMPQKINFYSYDEETGLRSYDFNNEANGFAWLHLDKNLNVMTPLIEGYGQFIPINSEYTIASKDFGTTPERWDSAVINKNKNFVIPHGKYTDIQRFNDSLLIVEKDKKYGLIDIKENIIIPIEYDHIGGLDENLLSVSKNFKYGVMDKTGKTVIPCEYEKYFEKHSDIFLVYAPYDKSFAQIFDLNGKLLTKIDKFNSMSDIKNRGIFISFTSWGPDAKFLKADGTFFDLGPFASTHYINIVDDEYYVLTKNDTDERIVIDENYNVILSLKGGSIDYVGNGVFAHRSYEGKLIAYYDLNGTDATERFKGMTLSYLEENLFTAYQNNKVGVVDKDGNVVISFMDIKALSKVSDTLYLVQTTYGKIGFAEVNGSGMKVNDYKDGIVLSIGSTGAKVDGEAKECDAAPIIRNGRTMLPARFVAENLGAEVAWDAQAQTVTITGEIGSNVKIVLTIGSDKAQVGYYTETLDSPAFIENGRTYTPVRFVAEKLGANVIWDPDTQSVQIVKP